MSIVKGLAIAATLATFAVNAGATTVTLGVGSSTLPMVVPAGGILGPSVSFNDIFNFTLAGPGKISYQVSEKEVVFGYPDPSSSLGFSVAQIYDISDTSFTYGLYNASNTLVTDLNNLTSGAYYIKVSGTTTGLFGGQYTLKTTITALPVPEPETNLMMLLGLAAIGTLTYRKKNSL